MSLILAFGFGRDDLILSAVIILLTVFGHKLAEFGRRLGGGPGGPKAA